MLWPSCSWCGLARRLLNENGPSPLSKTGAVIPMRQARGATVTGASINAPRILPVPKRARTAPVHAGGPIHCRQPDRQGAAGRPILCRSRLHARPPAGESPVTGGSGALRIAGAAGWSAQRKMHDMVFRLHRRSGPQGGVGRDVAGHSFRTGKPCCHPSRTQAPSGVVLHPTPHPPAPQAGPARAKVTKAPKQAKRIIGSAPRGIGPRG
jgi:hypothetical protein